MNSISLTKMVFVLTLTSSEGGPWLPKTGSPALLALHRGGSGSLEQPVNCTYLMHSVWSVPGERQYMEDEYYVSGDGSFAAVFDGHGGSAVSRYLRQNLYASYQAALPTSQNMHNLSEDDKQLESAVSSALRSAFKTVDEEVQNIVHWSFQGSTACAIVIHENISCGTRSIISANVGDSRAILSRNGTAIELTKDHKPNNPIERERIEALGGSVDWCGELNEKGEPIEGAGVYRINGNLALSRSIGDRCERPWVSSEVDVSRNTVDDDVDSFVLLASDGLFDVMTSQDAVAFIHEQLANTKPEDHQNLQKNIAKLVVNEALKRGTLDNITVMVIWFITRESSNLANTNK